MCWRYVIATRSDVSNSPSEIHRLPSFVRTDPVVDPEIWDTIKDTHRPPSEKLGGGVKRQEHDSKTNIAQEDIRQLRVLEESTIFAEVIVTVLRETSLALLTANIVEHVSWPSAKLVYQTLVQCHNWGILSQVCKVNACWVAIWTMVVFDPVISRIRHKNNLALEITGGLVMMRVSNSPAVVWNHEEGMQQQAKSVVNSFGFAESAMAAFVCENPDSCHDQPGQEGAAGVGQDTQSRVTEEGNIRVC